MASFLMPVSSLIMNNEYLLLRTNCQKAFYPHSNFNIAVINLAVRKPSEIFGTVLM